MMRVKTQTVFFFFFLLLLFCTNKMETPQAAFFSARRVFPWVVVLLLPRWPAAECPRMGDDDDAADGKWAIPGGRRRKERREDERGRKRRSSGRKRKKERKKERGFRRGTAADRPTDRTRPTEQRVAGRRRRADGRGSFLPPRIASLMRRLLARSLSHSLHRRFSASAWPSSPRRIPVAGRTDGLTHSRTDGRKNRRRRAEEKQQVAASPSSTSSTSSDARTKRGNLAQARGSLAAQQKRTERERERKGRSDGGCWMNGWRPPCSIVGARAPSPRSPSVSQCSR